ncbi:MAG: ABC transporter ATP-binding protein [Planctomycetota bacterium]|jgi:branched-chain amino acid transport system ATP-binding protein|nr:ABC transporter ATP-binding protein [Planctomycetota bacterium]
MPSQPILETRDLSIAFGEYKAVDKVDFLINTGDCAGIIGPNGAGKSTFFNMLTGMYTPTAGAVFYQGVNITRLPVEKRVALGMVRTFQLVSVFDSLTVLQNMIPPVDRFRRQYANKRLFYFGEAESPEVVECCRTWLAKVGIEKRGREMTANLSYGEKRKLEIAMALSLEPKILLLDEPLAGLSDVEIKDVLGLIGGLRGKFTILLIEHKISQIQNLVRRLSVMHEGRMIAQGEPLEIIHDREIRRIYWGAGAE